MHPDLLRPYKTRPKKIISYVLVSFVFLMLAGIAFWGVQWFSNSLEGLLIDGKSLAPASLQLAIPDVAASQKEPLDLNQNIPLRNWVVEDLTLQAGAAVVVEMGPAKPKVLFHKNEQQKLPVASLAKLMTALVVLERYDVSQNVMISQNAMSQVGEQGNLQPGEVLSVHNLLHIMLMESSNRAAYALAEVMGPNHFISLMNEKARTLGLTGTHFQDSTGLDSASYSTAMDMVVLTRHLYENYPLFREIIGLARYDAFMSNGAFHHTLETTNELLGHNTIIGGKTGFTSQAKGCLMMVLSLPGAGPMPTPGNPALQEYLITVVLGSDNRFEEMQRAIGWIDSAYIW